ncbi:hypothetical protein [Chishuiella sp.]|uniref:hypothetical protein n=1 Tax=Chishuiella sp. TaxID=1969467 RepID=UPI0028B05305|nr:hypothetical protein [Chishuiella sp.]
MNYKKILTLSIVILLILVGVAIIIGSNKYRRVFFIDSFQNPIESKISSKPNKDYSYEIVRIKGNTNDTIIIQPCEKCEAVKLSGKINQKFMNEFKTGKSIMHFQPYKATEGKLKIVHKIR